ncbi:MAG: dihydrodipicolinate synthase family protein [Dehalococcoidia bacterium]|nr:dihydrodipicolinate synthase family protein [Dehalococcoidia bacterium]MSQ34493.1 dihydrodipicolinate synthase family protein [Dehalococcoidia bacterium]
MFSNTLDGIHFMLPTPFRDSGEVDPNPYDRLVGAAARAGCRGVVCLGVMGEAHRLTDSERSQVLASVIAAAQKHKGSGGSLTVTAGISSESNRVAALRAKEAKAAGATAVMAAPARLAKPNPQSTYGYYAAIAEASDLPLVVQDLPEQTGVHMDPQFIAKLNAEFPTAKYLKLEDPPTPPKITRVLAATGKKMSVFGGLGGAFLFEELRRGAAGTMTGFAYPEVLVAVYRRMSEGDTEGARDVFYRWLPLIRYENSAGIGLSIRKHIMARRGFLDQAAVRVPTPAIDNETREELEDILAHMDLDVSKL